MKSFVVSRKNVKQAIKNVSAYLKQAGFSIPHTTLLDLTAKMFFAKNWQTLNASFDTPEERQVKKEKVLVIDTPLGIPQLKALFEEIGKKANCLYSIEEIREYGSKKEFYFSVKLQNGIESNFLVFMFLLAQHLKGMPIPVKEIKLWDTRVECQDLMPVPAFDAKRDKAELHSHQASSENRVSPVRPGLKQRR